MLPIHHRHDGLVRVELSIEAAVRAEVNGVDWLLVPLGQVSDDSGRALLAVCGPEPQGSL
jgi:hypothetical protein